MYLSSRSIYYDCRELFLSWFLSFSLLLFLSLSRFDLADLLLCISTMPWISYLSVNEFNGLEIHMGIIHRITFVAYLWGGIGIETLRFAFDYNWQPENTHAISFSNELNLVFPFSHSFYRSSERTKNGSKDPDLV